MQITTIGLDIAERVFQVYAADSTGQAVPRRRRQRSKVLAFFGTLASRRRHPSAISPDQLSPGQPGIPPRPMSHRASRGPEKTELRRRRDSRSAPTLGRVHLRPAIQLSGTISSDGRTLRCRPWVSADHPG